DTTSHLTEHSLEVLALQQRWQGTVRAPDFPPDVDWLNVSQPLSLADLRGHIVILDFWTFC
ncbi:MAG TPA: hypothetical protein VNL16_10875, partial [Chloroflexota bacterium]|nr:hypothetical protein [Chloroflexota bacterium]